MKPKMLRLVALWLGCFSSVALLLSFLALTDIYHGEPDVSLEWMIVRFAFPTWIAFHIAALTALRRPSDLI